MPIGTKYHRLMNAISENSPIYGLYVILFLVAIPGVTILALGMIYHCEPTSFNNDAFVWLLISSAYMFAVTFLYMGIVCYADRYCQQIGQRKKVKKKSRVRGKFRDHRSF